MDGTRTGKTLIYVEIDHMKIQYHASEVAKRLNARLVGDDVLLTNISSIENAEIGDLVFAESQRYLALALKSHAAAIIVPATLQSSESKPLLVVENPRVAFTYALELFSSPKSQPIGIHPTAIIAESAIIGQNVSIGANVCIEANVDIGDDVVLYPGVYVGEDSKIGAGTILFPNVVLYSRITIGRQSIIHAGCVIGADGFGFVPVGHGVKKIPHLGTVEIGDDVEIGANSCVDRAKTDKTVIGSGTKLDNLVQVAHNVTIGISCLIASQVGIGGSTKIGNGVILGGQVGVRDHAQIGDMARVGGQGGVIGDVPPGATYSGYPARPHAQKLREQACVSQLPESVKQIREMQQRLEALEAFVRTLEASKESSI